MSKHQDSSAKGRAGKGRGGPCGGAAIRAQGERLQDALQGKRSRLPDRGGRGSVGLPEAARIAQARRPGVRRSRCIVLGGPCLLLHPRFSDHLYQLTSQRAVG